MIEIICNCPIDYIGLVLGLIGILLSYGGRDFFRKWWTYHKDCDFKTICEASDNALFYLVQYLRYVSETMPDRIFDGDVMSPLYEITNTANYYQELTEKGLMLELTGQVSMWDHKFIEKPNCKYFVLGRALIKRNFKRHLYIGKFTEVVHVVCL